MTTTHRHFLGLIFGIGLALNFLSGCGGCSGGSHSSQGSTPPTLASIEVNPTNTSIAIGTTQQFTATGIYSDSTKQDLTTSVTWSSSSTATATISDTADSKGLATALDAGSATITATSGNISGSATLTVKAAAVMLVSIEIAPTNSSIALGTTQQFTATGIFSDNTKQDLTTQVNWSSSNPGFATIDNTGLATSVAAGSSAISATLGSVSGSTALTVTPATLVSIGVTPINTSIALETSQQFTATGRYSDNTTQDLAADVIWSSSNTGVVSVSNATGSNGLATSVAAGSATITATLGNISGSTTLTVTSAAIVSIDVKPTSHSIPLGTALQFAATGTFSDGTIKDMTTDATWKSSDETHATISNAIGSNGLAAPVAVGQVTITATFGSISGSTTLTVTSATLVSIGVTPANPSIPLGITQRFTATGIYSDNTTQDLTAEVTWSSSNTGVATMSNAEGTNGTATPIATGSATVTATLGSLSGSSSLTVASATLVSIYVTPTNPGIALGTTQQFTATGTYTDNTTKDLTSEVAWSSSDTAVASVSNAEGSNGLATSFVVGSSTITAAMGSVSGSTALTVTSATLVSIEVAPTNPSIALGTTLQFAATGRYSDNTAQDLTTQVIWSSSNTGVASVSNETGSNGMATPVAAGSATITATLGSASGSTTLTATSATIVSIDITPTNPVIPLGTEQQFAAMGNFSDGTIKDITAEVVWTSSDTGVASVSNAAGSEALATSVAAGSTSITAALGSVSGTTTLTITSATLVSIEVAPTNPIVPKGIPQQFTATGIYSDSSTQVLTAEVTWSSSDETVAIISNATGSNGRAASIAVGSTTITAALGSKSGDTSLAVTSATLVSIDVTPTNPSIARGTKQQFTATGIYSDNINRDLTAEVTWSSSDTTVAVISNALGSNGLASSLATGSTTITAALGSVSGSTSLAITSAILVSIDVTPTNPSIPKGMNQQFMATGIFSDETAQELTAEVIWSSFNTGVATISNVTGSNGLATSIMPGSTTITATLWGVSGSAILTVTPETLVSIAITPANPSVALGTTQQFSATGSYTDSSTRDITKFVTWNSSNTAVATVSNAGGTKGLAIPVGVGSTIITAISGSIVSNNAALTVTSATLTTITISPPTPKIALGTTQQFTATGAFSDGSTQDLTTAVTWSSTVTTVATISNAAESNGLATSVGTGQTFIKATFGSISESTKLTVAPNTLVSIAVIPANPTIGRGQTQQFTATGTYSDNSTQDLTKSVTWSSLNKNIATVSNAKGTRGLATGISAGSTTIRAITGGLPGTTTLTVVP